jgi:hypothetical protein
MCYMIFRTSVLQLDTNGLIDITVVEENNQYHKQCAVLLLAFL